MNRQGHGHRDQLGAPVAGNFIPRSARWIHASTLFPAHRWRGDVVPVPSPADAPRLTTAMTLATRLDWATLLRRVWGPDVTACPRCA
jgi:hypothetical protein